MDRSVRRSKINKSTEEKNAGSESILPGNALDKNESGANCLGKRKKSSRNRQPAGRSSTNWSLDQWLENCMHPDSGIVNSTATGPLILSRENNSSPRIFPTMSQAYPANVYEPIYNHTPLSFSTPDASKNGPSHVHGSDLGSPSNELERENAPKSLQENLQGAADVEKNRFSDLGMTSMSDNDSKERDEEDELSPTSSRDHSNANNRPAIEAKDGKLLATLLEQISLLHDTNAKICRNLHETKGMYTPGMVTDVIREVRDGARIREEAMIHKVKSMLEENSWAMSEMKIKLMREMEELKMEMQHLRTEKKELSNKVLKMENEMHTLRVAMNNNNSAKVQKTNSLDAEKHLNSAHVNYGVVKQEDGEFYEVDIVNSPAKKYSTAFENRIAKPVTINSDQNRFYATQVLNNGSNKPLDSMTKSLSSGHLVQQEKDTLELRRELQDAIAGKKHAERRILDLERTVANLQKGMNRSSPTVDGSQEITTNSTMTKSAERHSSHVKIDLESPNGKNSTIIPVASQIQTVGQKAKICLTGMVTDL
ncbi:uncharacterized protein LOC132264981 isoform X3 [Phlebotomus argentipes]|uniref:uncharacterized protein LOC132264981 isoform X3 n=1 Tax=Phlebotomus argentipes TaxID=94469 RepID=UPI00289322AE|nr:uncharacterized protein LOC132264981 isoform X3 [Phlebotomus argentipes]